MQDNLIKSKGKRRIQSVQAAEKSKTNRLEGQLQSLMDFMEECKTKENAGSHPLGNYPRKIKIENINNIKLNINNNYQ
jgi:hypothetical protein